MRNPGDESLRGRGRAARLDPRDPASAVAYATELERRGDPRRAVAALKKAGLTLDAAAMTWRYDLQRTRWYRSKSSLTDLPEDEIPEGMPAYMDTLDVYYYYPSRGVESEANRRYGLLWHQVTMDVPGATHGSTDASNGGCEVQLAPDGRVREFVETQTPDYYGATIFDLDLQRNPILGAFVQRYYLPPTVWSATATREFQDDLRFALDVHWLLGWPIAATSRFEPADPDDNRACARCDGRFPIEALGRVDPEDDAADLMCYECRRAIRETWAKACDGCDVEYEPSDLVPFDDRGTIEELCPPCLWRRRRGR